jgi:hypothetical protein
MAAEDFRMVSCTTGLHGTYMVHVQDPGEDPGEDFYPECRVHAIGYVHNAQKQTQINMPWKAGTWYLITTKDPRLLPFPIWVHEEDGNLNLVF